MPIPVPGRPAPQFKAPAVVNGELKDISLDQLKGRYTVLFFYPLDFTFVCPTEIVAFSDRQKEFEAINCNLVGCSIDSEFTHLAFVNTPRNKGGLGGCNYPLMSDKNRKIANDYGVLIDNAAYGEDGATFRALFIIDPKGTLRQVTINDLPVGRSVDEALRLVKAFQFTDEHGEVCPANWTPGAKTMKGDPVKKMEYFSTLS
uniref:Peroxiredoxin n=1 Tax=Dunaliella viridis TaxID=140095 RepID=I3WBF8_9CHLO|nr:2-cys peroxiredoxin [Dunaliella viridis]